MSVSIDVKKQNVNGRGWIHKKSIVKGIRHQENNMKCQDYADAEYRDGKISIALADGTGMTDMNAAAVVYIVEKINQFLIDNYDNICDMERSDELTVADNLMLQIRRLIEEKRKEWGVDRKELASTLLGFCINEKDNTYCAVHLGDGVIAAQERDGHISILSRPTNGDRINETVLSTSEKILKYVKVYRGNLKDIQGILLASDGVYRDVFDRINIERCFSQGKGDDILIKNADDQAVIMLYVS